MEAEGVSKAEGGMSDQWLTFRASRFDAESWAALEYLSEPGAKVRFGIKSLDSHLASGLHEGVNVLMAEPGAGKTALGCHLAYTAAKDCTRAAVISLEMTASDTWLRIASEHAAVTDYLEQFEWGDTEKWRRQTYESYMTGDVADFDGAISHDPVLRASEDLWYQVPNLIVTDCGGDTDISAVVAEIGKLSAMGCRLVVIDYLQRISMAGSNRYESLTLTSHALTDEIRKDHIVAVVISSMGRNARRTGETMAGADGTGAIEYDAETVWRMDKAEEGSEDPKDSSAKVIKVTIAKNRHGLTTGEDNPIYFSFWPSINLFR